MKIISVVHLHNFKRINFVLFKLGYLHIKIDAALYDEISLLYLLIKAIISLEKGGRKISKFAEFSYK